MFEPSSESRSSARWNGRPDRILSRFWTFHTWLEAQFHRASNGTSLMLKFVLSKRELSKQVYVQNLPRCCVNFLYIYVIVILQKYMVRHKFCKNIHLPPWPRRQGHNVVAHSSRSRQEWACHTCFSKENQVQTYMHARIKFHAYSDI
jgi:hypothetical protein